jgi:cyclase
MRSTMVGSALIATVALCLGTAGHAQTAERKMVRMQTLNVRDILYVMTNGGGNTLALMRDDGVVLIDTKLTGWGRPLSDAVQAVTDKPVTTIINTHAHEDHSAGNVDFPSATKIIAHENAKTSMQKMPAFAGANAKFLPNTLVTDRLSLLEGPDRMDIYYFGRGHTNGDLVIVFPEKRLAHLGDLFPGKMAPSIDTANGGSAVELPKTLARIATELKGIFRVTTGHDDATAVMGKAPESAISANPRTMTWNELQEYADFNRDFLAAVQQSITERRTAAEAFAALKLPERYKAYDMREARANVEAIYKELGK